MTAAVTRAKHVRVHDGSFPDRVGWKAIVAQPGTGTAVRSSAPSGDPTHGLRSYPQDMLSSPLDERSASLSVRPGDGTLVAPRVAGGRQLTTQNRAGDGFAGVFADAAAGKGVLVFLLLAAFAWGALHALSPGHGKTMVAAYLVATRGTAKHALALGATVTITHTIGVFALGLVRSRIGFYRVRRATAAGGFDHPLAPAPGRAVASPAVAVSHAGADAVALGRRFHAHDHRRGHAHAHDHGHAHDHHPPENLGWRSLIGMGASAGLIPCPSALVVLLGAIAQHQVALGLLMIAVFSLGLAGTLTGIGLLVVHARRATTRLSLSGPWAAALPAISAIVIGAGCVLTAQALPQLL